MNPERSVAAIVFGFLILVVTVELLRRRKLREKYAALWLTVSVVTLFLAIFPEPLFHVSDWLGFGLPSNLVFFAGGTVLLVISMQLSSETGRLESETQRLAEEHALLQLEVRELKARLDADSGDDAGADPSGPTTSRPTD